MLYAKVNKSSITVTFPYDKELVAAIKSIGPGVAKWNPDKKQWSLKPTIESIEFLFNKEAIISEKGMKKIGDMITALEEKMVETEHKKSLARSLEADPFPELEALVNRDEIKEIYPYQWVPLHYALGQKNVAFILADSMGLGKSLEVMLITLHERFAHHPVLIVAPASCTGNWVDEIWKSFGIKAKNLTSPIDKLDPDIRYYVVSYDRLKYFVEEKVVGKDKDGEPEYKRFPKPIMKEYDWIILADEALAIKNQKTVKHKNLKCIRKCNPHIILMTGTPMSNDIMDLYGPLALLDTDFMSWSAFATRYAGMEWGYFGRVFKGPMNQEELNEMLDNHYMVRRTKEQVCKHLPPNIRQAVNIGNVTGKAVGSNVLELFSANAKYKAQDKKFLDWVTNRIEESDKILLFAHHQVMLDALAEIFKKNKWKFVRIDGKVASGEPRQKLVRAFQEDPDIRGGLLSLTASGMGLTLTASSNSIHTEFYWDPATHWQAEDRSHRHGQKNTVFNVYPLVTEFDHYLYELVVSKMSTFTRVIEGGVADSVPETSLLREVSMKYGVPIKG